MLKRILATVLIVFFLSTSPVFADDTMRKTLTDSLYGGIIGSVIGLAIVLLTDNPDDHLNYIPTGAGIGILAGAAYGLASSGVVASVPEYESFDHTAPPLKVRGVFDRLTNTFEIVGSIDLLKIRF